MNHAIGATSSMYHASCVTADAADADLVIVELTLNDYTGPEMDITKSPSKCAPVSGQCSNHHDRLHIFEPELDMCWLVLRLLMAVFMPGLSGPYAIVRWAGQTVPH